MKALTVKQPWATLIMLGLKPVENRSWRPPSSLIGERFVIHAGKGYDKNADGFLDSIGLELPENLPSGCLLGTVKLDSVVTDFESPWFSGPLGWIIKDPVLFPSPRKARGKLGLWKVDKKA